LKSFLALAANGRALAQAGIVAVSARLQMPIKDGEF